MRTPTPLPSLAVALAAMLGILSTAPARAAAPTADEGWTPLFNGKDLSGWKFRQQAGSQAWKVVSDVRLDPADPKKLLGEGEGGSDRGVLLRGTVDHPSELITEK
jgi:hypothetical protein